MKKQFKLEIDKTITEQKLIENCLNMKSSGYNCDIVFLFYALGKRWHVDKLLYYTKLLEKTQ